MVGELSLFPNNGNQQTTQDYDYFMETMSEMFDVDGLLEGSFPITFNIVYQYQQ